MASFGGDALSTLLGFGVIAFIILSIWSKIAKRPMSSIIREIVKKLKGEENE